MHVKRKKYHRKSPFSTVLILKLSGAHYNTRIFRKFKLEQLILMEIKPNLTLKINLVIHGQSHSTASQF